MNKIDEMKKFVMNTVLNKIELIFDYLKYKVEDKGRTQITEFFDFKSSFEDVFSLQEISKMIINFSNGSISKT